MRFAPFTRSISHATAVAIALIAGCDKFGSSTNSNTTNAAESVPLIATNPAAPLPTSLAIESLATLPPGKPTLLAATPEGGIFAVQSASDGTTNGDVQRIDAGSAKPTGLTAAAVLRALGMNAAASSSTASTGNSDAIARGHFTALAARGDNKLAFCFAGVSAARPFVAVGTFDPNADAQHGSALFVPVDQILLGAAGDANLATDAAQLFLFTSGDDAWLWRATDKIIRLVKITGLSAADPKITLVDVNLDKARDATTTDVERNAWEWSATPKRDEFLLTDIASRWIRKIDETGTLTHVARFDADAVPTLSAAAQDAAGRAIVFACDRDGIASALLVQDGGTFKSIPRSAFTVPLPLDAARLRLDRLLPVPRETNAFVAYDATSGAVVCVRLK